MEGRCILKNYCLEKKKYLWEMSKTGYISTNPITSNLCISSFFPPHKFPLYLLPSLPPYLPSFLSSPTLTCIYDLHREKVETLLLKVSSLPSMIHCYGAFHVKHNNKMYITLEMFPSQN
jgi:hypothetical protein